MLEIAATLCATLSITAMGCMTSILGRRAHSYQLAHDEITRQYGSEGVKSAPLIRSRPWRYINLLTYLLTKQAPNSSLPCFSDVYCAPEVGEVATVFGQKLAM